MTALCMTETRRLFHDPIEDYTSIAYTKETLKLEDAITSITQQRSKSLNIDQLIDQREIYILQRNKILDNPFKAYLPRNRKKLRHIENCLDNLDVKIYSLQTEHFDSPNLEEILFLADQKLRKYS